MQDKKSPYEEVSEWYEAISNCLNQVYSGFPLSRPRNYLENNEIPQDARETLLVSLMQVLEKANYIFNQAHMFLDQTELRSLDLKNCKASERLRYDSWFQSQIDSLNLWNRRIVETIVHLIGFKGTDEEDYYKHYLLLVFLKDKNSFIDDMRVYYEIETKTVGKGVKVAKRNIDAVLKNIDVSRCWYIQSGKPYKMASQKDKFTFAVSKMDIATRNTIPMYTFAFSKASKSLHFDPSPTVTNLGLEDLYERLKESWILIFLALQHLQSFLTVKINNEALDQFSSSITENPDMQGFWSNSHRHDIKEGNIVLVGTSVGRVLKVISSQFGYRSFRVKFLFPNRDPDIEVDDFPAPSVRLLPTKGIAKAYIKSTAEAFNWSVPDHHINDLLDKG